MEREIERRECVLENHREREGGEVELCAHLQGKLAKCNLADHLPLGLLAYSSAYVETSASVYPVGRSESTPSLALSLRSS